jgi:hypothetical protein
MLVYYGICFFFSEQRRSCLDEHTKRFNGVVYILGWAIKKGKRQKGRKTRVNITWNSSHGFGNFTFI